MKTSYIPLFMAVFTVGLFIFFTVNDFSTIDHKRKYFVRHTAKTNEKPADFKRNRLPRPDKKNNYTRPSLVAGVVWPKLLDITPRYSSLIPRLWKTAEDALMRTEETGEKYPAYVDLLSIIENWNPDDADAPEYFTETLQHFNYSDENERRIAMRFRDAEIPFKLYDVPEVDAVVHKWTDDYLAKELKTHNHMVEISKDNHFMFWKDKDTSRSYPSWKAPTKHINMDFPTWLKIAQNADRSKLKDATTHHYFLTNAPTGDRETFVARDLNFFATDTKNFFITNVDANKGIQCRFGMRGIIAETHYDGGKNMVAVLKGRKRYLLNPPVACRYLAIIPDNKHPSFRHSLIDWSDVDECRRNKFDEVPGIDTIVQTGEVLYIPSYWFHYPISLDYSIQCNSRSGSPTRREGQKEIEECTGRTMAEQKLRK